MHEILIVIVVPKCLNFASLSNNFYGVVLSWYVCDETWTYTECSRHLLKDQLL